MKKKILIGFAILVSISSFAAENSSVGIKIDNSYLSGNFLLRTYKTEYFEDKYVEKAKESTFKFIKAYMEGELNCNTIIPVLSELKLVQISANCPTSYNIQGSLKMSRWKRRIGHLTADIFDFTQSHEEPILKLDHEY